MLLVAVEVVLGGRAVGEFGVGPGALWMLGGAGRQSFWWVWCGPRCFVDVGWKRDESRFYGGGRERLGCLS